MKYFSYMNLTLSFCLLSQDQLVCDGGVVISAMVRSGCGLWMSFKDKSYVRLYHIETKEHLQEINIGSTVDQMMSGRRHCLYNSLYNSLYKSAEKIQYLYGHILTKCGFFSFYIKLLNQHRDLKGTY